VYPIPGCSCGCCCAGKKRGITKYANAETPIAVNNEVMSAVFRTEFFMACLSSVAANPGEEPQVAPKLRVFENQRLESRSPGGLGAISMRRVFPGL
jgi:hypothetical protein